MKRYVVESRWNWCASVERGTESRDEARSILEGWVSGRDVPEPAVDYVNYGDLSYARVVEVDDDKPPTFKRAESGGRYSINVSQYGRDRATIILAWSFDTGIVSQDDGPIPWDAPTFDATQQFA